MYVTLYHTHSKCAIIIFLIFLHKNHNYGIIACKITQLHKMLQTLSISSIHFRKRDIICVDFKTPTFFQRLKNGNYLAIAFRAILSTHRFWQKHLFLSSTFKEKIIICWITYSFVSCVIQSSLGYSVTADRIIIGLYNPFNPIGVRGEIPWKTQHNGGFSWMFMKAP